MKTKLYNLYIGAALLFALGISYAVADVQKTSTGQLYTDSMAVVPAVGLKSGDTFIPLRVGNDGTIKTASADSPLALVSTQTKVKSAGALMIDTGDGIAVRGAPLVGITDSGAFVPLLVDGSGKLITDGGGGGGGGATTALDNLTATAINANLIWGTDNAFTLGDSAFRTASVFTKIVQESAAGPRMVIDTGVGLLRTGSAATTNSVDFFNRTLKRAGNQTVVNWSGSTTVFSGAGGISSGQVTAGAYLINGASAGTLGVRFLDSDASNFIDLVGPTTVATDVTFTLPDSPGTSGQFLSTDGTGILSWVTSSGGGANQALSNLTSPTSINQSLLTDGTARNIGNDSGKHFGGLFLSGGISEGTSGIEFINIANRTINDVAGTPMIDLATAGNVYIRGIPHIPNDTYLYARNGTNTADVEIAKVTTGSYLIIGKEDPASPYLQLSNTDIIVHTGNLSGDFSVSAGLVSLNANTTETKLIVPLADDSYNIGAPTFRYTNGYFAGAMFADIYYERTDGVALNLWSIDKTGANSNPIRIYSGTTTTSGNTGDIHIKTGDAAEASGNIIIQPGAFTTTQGQVTIYSNVNTAGASPGSVAQGSAGTGATCVLESGSTDLAGQIQLTTGTGATSGEMCLTTFVTAFPNRSFCVISAGNNNAADATTGGNWYITSDSGDMSLWTTASPNDATSYYLTYHCIGQ